MKLMENELPQMVMVGWREYIALPAVGIEALKAKIDTGAETSALHAEKIEIFPRNGVDWVRFEVPINKHKEVYKCELPLCDKRRIRSSNGIARWRYIIETDVIIGKRTLKTQFSLTSRASMKFPVLLGRRLLAENFAVDVSRSYLCGKMGAGAQAAVTPLPKNKQAA